MNREAMEADIEATWPGDYSPGAVRCYCRMFISGELHNWLRPHAQIPGLCIPRRRSWWHWLAMIASMIASPIGAWIVYRAIAGWPW